MKEDDRPSMSHRTASENRLKSAVPSAREESAAGERTDSASPSPASLWDQVLERSNLQRALKQVRQNKGAPGIDGMRVDDLPGFLRQNWPAIRAQLEAGRYCPQPVRRVRIPKADGRERLLGIPTVLDRFIQQAIAQVVSAQWDPHFHPRSYGFRPGKSAHQALKRLQADIRAGRQWTVDLDLAAFFDRVNHDRLMHRLKTHVPEPRLLRLIGRFLKAGVMDAGQVQATTAGVPQGGPLSPVLANVVLDELDWELDRRGHRFVRYADDCQILVKSQRAGERVMSSIQRFVEDSLRLEVNTRKSAVDRPWNRQFLGLTVTRGDHRLKVSPKALDRLKNPLAGPDPPHTRPPFGRCRCRLERLPAWMESVLRYCRGTEPTARDRQMAAATITLLSLEAMGPLGLPPAAPSGRERAGCLADVQIGPRAVAAVAHPGAVSGFALKVLC